jgi:hypothetical protein
MSSDYPEGQDGRGLRSGPGRSPMQHSSYEFLLGVVHQYHCSSLIISQELDHAALPNQKKLP